MKKGNFLKNTPKLELLFFVLIVFTSLFLSIYFIDNTNKIYINILSIFSALTGIICTWLIAYKSIWNYFWAVLNILSYSIISLIAFIYGDFILYFFIYLPINIYGFWMWKKSKKLEKYIEPKSILKKPKFVLYYFLIFIVFFSIILLILSNTNDNFPYLDALSTSIAIIGILLQVNLYKEQYFVWFFVNVVSIVLWAFVFLSGETYALPIIINYSVYLLINFYGFWKWFYEKKLPKEKYVGYIKISDTGTKAIYK